MSESKPYGWARKVQAGRSAKAREMDARRRAVRTFGKDLGTREYGLWKRDPGRYDIEGIDTLEGEVPSAPEVEYIVEDEVEVPVVHLTGPIDGKPGGKCPYCGRSSWGRATMEFVPRGVLRRSRCRSCGNEVLFLEDRTFDWIDDSGEWAVGPVPEGTVTKTERRAQKAVFHVIYSWGVPELYTVWRANIGAVSRAAGFPEPVREQAAALLESERERLSGKRSGLAGRFRR